jgi:hypothetical protein
MRAFVVMGFWIENDNRVYDRENDPEAVYPDTVVMAPAKPVVKGIDFVLLDPSEPGTVKGAVTNESGIDTARVMVALFDWPTPPAQSIARCATRRCAYNLPSVKPADTRCARSST